MAAIFVSNLGKAYKQYPNRWSRLVEWLDPRNISRHKLHWVLQGISFTVQPGEAVGILGINGAGKSTLLKMITGTTRPTVGSVQISGRVAALLELGMGFHPDFTGRQNVFMAGQLLGYSIDEITRLVPEIEAFAEIGDYIDQPLRIYSSGMQARLAFAVATASCPEVLIVDEALSVGDARFQAKCFERISQYKKQGMTLLLVTHAALDLVKHCERAIFIENGRIKADGQSKDVVNAYLDSLFGISRKPHIEKNERLSSNKAHTSPILNPGKYEDRAGYRKEEYRWGQGGAKIIDYLLCSDGVEYPATITTGSLVDVYFSVFFETDIEFVTPGILIKSIDGIFIYGTNSFIASAGNATLSAERGTLSTFKFSFPMMLNEGVYMLSLGISAGDPTQQTTPIDRRYDSILFTVKNPIHMWGMVNMNAEFSVMSESRNA